MSASRGAGAAAVGRLALAMVCLAAPVAAASRSGPSPSAPAPAADSGRRETAILAGGCFWGMEDVLREVPGVIDTEVGYTGGHLPSPTARQVASGTTGHAEAIRIVFDPARLPYEELLELYFRMHDPTTRNQQGNDVGSQYRSAIFCSGADQCDAAERVRAKVEASGRWRRPLTTEVVRAGRFWSAEEKHQDYLEKHPGGYSCHYLRDIDFD